MLAVCARDEEELAALSSSLAHAEVQNADDASLPIWTAFGSCPFGRSDALLGHPKARVDGTPPTDDVVAAVVAAARALGAPLGGEPARKTLSAERA